MYKHIKSWQELEDYTQKILSDDRGKKPPLSGGSKKEEDVVGSNSIAQCKYTKNSSITMKADDIKRLLKAANDLDKLPLFISNSESGTFVTLELNEDIETVIKIAIVRKAINNIQKETNNIRNIRHLESIRKETFRLSKLLESYIKEEKDIIKHILVKCDNKYDDLTMFNLFE